MHILKMQEDVQKEHDKGYETVKALQAKINLKAIIGTIFSRFIK